MGAAGADLAEVHGALQRGEGTGLGCEAMAELAAGDLRVEPPGCAAQPGRARSRAAWTRAATTQPGSVKLRSLSSSARLTGRNSTFTSTRSSNGPESRAR